MKGNVERELQGRAVMQFANTLIGAFESGFVDTNELNLHDVYSAAKYYVKDNYDHEAEHLHEAWGESMFQACKGESNVKPTSWIVDSIGSDVFPVKIDRVVLQDDSFRFVVRHRESCLRKDREWVLEPTPSNRTDEFISNTRFNSLADAVSAVDNLEATLEDKTQPLRT